MPIPPELEAEQPRKPSGPLSPGLRRGLWNKDKAARISERICTVTGCSNSNRQRPDGFGGWIGPLTCEEHS